MIGGRGSIAPSIVNTKRKVERERIKDGLRAWLDRKADVVAVRGEKNKDDEVVKSVRGLVRRFTARWKADVQDPDAHAKRGNGSYGVGCSGKEKEAPTRAHVYGLRRFWEGLAKGQEGKV